MNFLRNWCEALVAIGLLAIGGISWVVSTSQPSVTEMQVADAQRARIEPVRDAVETDSSSRGIASEKNSEAK